MLATSLDTPKNPLIDKSETEDGEVGLKAKKRKLDEMEASGKYRVEKKKDGNRVAVGKIKGKITIPNRRGVDYAREKNLPELEEIAKTLPDNTVLDAEATALCNPSKCPNSNRCLYPTPNRECRVFCQIRCGTRLLHKVNVLKHRIPVQLEPFDILMLRGKNVEALPYLERKNLLKDLLDELDLPNVELVWHQSKGFWKLFRSELEGIMLKVTWARYLHDRCDYWFKCKRTYLKTGRVVGWTDGNGKNQNLWGSLVLVDPEDFKLIGRCGGGFTDAERKMVKTCYLNLAPLKREYYRYEVNKSWTPIETPLKIQTLFQEFSKYGILYAPRMWKILEPQKLIA